MEKKQTKTGRQTTETTVSENDSRRLEREAAQQRAIRRGLVLFIVGVGLVAAANFVYYYLFPYTGFAYTSLLADTLSFLATAFLSLAAVHIVLRVGGMPLTSVLVSTAAICVVMSSFLEVTGGVRLFDGVAIIGHQGEYHEQIKGYLSLRNIGGLVFLVGCFFFATIEAHAARWRLAEEQDKLLEEIKERKRAEQALKFRIDFERVVTGVSTHFVNLKSEQIDAGIDFALKSLGEFMGVEHAYIYVFSDDGSRITMSHEWCAEGVDPRKADFTEMPLQNESWFVEHVKNRETINIPSPDSIPPDASRLREIMDNYGLQSIVSAPVAYQDRLVGYLGVDSSKPLRNWDHDAIGLLRILGEMLAGVFQRKRSEEALSHEQFLLHTLMDNVPDHIYFKDRQSRFLRLTRSLAGVFGLADPDEALGKTDFDFFSEEHARQAYEDEQHLMQTGEALVNVEEKETWPDGRVGWASTTKLPLRDREGKIVGTFGISRDITQRRRTEELTRIQRDLGVALSAAVGLEETLQLCFNAAIRTTGMDSGGVYLTNQETGVMELAFQKGLSDEFIDHISFWQPEASYMSLVDNGTSIFLSGRELSQSEFEPWVAEGLKSMAVIPIRHENQLIGTLNLASHSLEEVPEDVRHVLETISMQMASVVARVTAEEALRQSEAKYRTILQTIVEGYYEVSLDGRLVFFNESVCNILGYSPDELKGINYRKLFTDKKTAKAVQETFTKVLEKGLPEKGYWELRTKTGQTRHVESSISLMRDSNGDPAGFRGIVRDVTERKRAEEERQRLEVKIQQAQKLESLGVLAGGIAHDFNNLLMGVLGNSSLALMRLPEDSPARNNLKQIETAAERAADLAKQMLAYSGKGKFVVQRVNLSELVEEMAHLLEVGISKQVELRYELDNDLPPIEGDATQIRQIVMNLITNASEAIGEEEGSVTIRTGHVQADRVYLEQTFLADHLEEGHYAFIEVSDTGCGMDAETRERLFDPFFTTKFTGRGLGLAAVMGIVRSHNGAVKVYSEPDQGSVFRVLIPFPDNAFETDAKTDAAIKKSSFPIKGTATGTILIVDDEETVRVVTQQVLEQAGFSVLKADDGREGIEVFKENNNDIVLVLLDLTMPGMGGREAFHEMQEINPDIPVLLSSGYDEEDATHQFAGEGLAGFLQKPYRAQDLMNKVNSILQPQET